MPTPNSYAVIDFETTGLSSSDRVIEIGVAFLDEHLQIEKTWDSLLTQNAIFSIASCIRSRTQMSRSLLHFPRLLKH